MTDHRAQVEELLADYRRSREQLATVHRALVVIQESVTSQDGMVTATVGAQGNLVALVVAEAAYQHYRPAQLGDLIVRVTAEAATRVAARASDAVAPVLPLDTDPAALLGGRADLSNEEITPPTVASPPDDEESFEQQTWMDDVTRGRSA